MAARPKKKPETDISGKPVVRGKNGGKRPGAGRPKGSRNALPLGTVGAVKSLRLRVPADASPEAAQLADRALERIVDVMEARCGFGGFAVLTAARAVREEICGPIKQQHELTGTGGGPITVEVKKLVFADVNPLVTQEGE